MRQSPFRSRLAGEFSRLNIHTLEASHRLAALNRHLDGLVAPPPLTFGLKGISPALLGVLLLAGFLLLI